MEGELFQRAIDRVQNPGSAPNRAVALRGFSWIVEPAGNGVVLAVEIPMGAAVAGPFAIAQQQLDALKRWLRQTNESESRRRMPKFILCGVGIAPISREIATFPYAWRSSDGWLGYPDELAELLGTILDHRIQHVVFVSGDLHLSSVSRLGLRDSAPAVLAG